MFDAGMLLIAPPNMPDPRFKQSVILITQHGINGTQGLCLNRPAPNTVNTLIEPLGHKLEDDQQIYWGGPVATTTLWLLHENTWTSENTMEVNDDWALTSSLQMFDQITVDPPRQQRYCIGLSSWAPGQLEAEIVGQQPWHREASWLVAHSPAPADLFQIPTRDLWAFCCEISAKEAVANWF
jgi:putative transcriptional regulator